MKNTILILVMLIVSNLTHGQNNYDKISEFGQYNGDWALIESNGLLGFIDREGNEVVKPKYDKISEFGQYTGDWALVESNGLLGFIDREGNEIVKPKYDKIQNEGKLQGETEGKIEIIKN